MMLPNAEIKPWLMNITTQDRCVKAWGDSSKYWIDKSIWVELKEQNVRGQIRTVIYGVPHKEESLLRRDLTPPFCLNFLCGAGL